MTLTKIIHNIETNEITEVELTLQEIEAIEANKIEAELQAKKTATKAAEKAALLEKLGITEDEAKLLLG